MIAVLLVPYLLSLRYSLAAQEATALIRHYLRYQSSQRYAELYRDGKINAPASQIYEEELEKINKLQFESVKIGRLFPDYFLSVRPTFYVKAVIRDDNGQLTTRYFHLGTDNLVIGETSEFLWALVL